MKIREFSSPQGRANRRMVRVRELAEGETVPPGAQVVADETEAHDWRFEEEA
jgi:hypothetical protein